MRARAEWALLGLAVIWGSTFVVIKAALTGISPMLFIAARFTIAALVLVPLYRRRLRRSAIPGGVLVGVLLFVAFVLQTEGLALTTPSKSAFLTGLSIPMVPFVNSVVYRTRPQIPEVVGILIASFGMALMTLPSGRFEMTRGDLLSLLCAIAFAVQFVALSHFSKSAGFETVSVMQVAVTAVLAILSVLTFGGTRFEPGIGLGAAVLATGLLATALAFTAMAWAQQFTTPVRAALILALEPAVAWLTSWAVTGEVLSMRGKMGAALILAGVLLVELKRSKPETLDI
ncbi:MAG TPA: DMT family transporter [Bryobacteraceae bacterium]|nr:DMT family transporter [Bryobacteraceae bacterium]